MPSDRLISQRLQYNAKTPAFLLALQGKVSGRMSNEDEDAEDPGMEQLDVNRPAIPRRPRGLTGEDQTGDGGDDDLEGGDEKPIVVVLKEGKHLTERQAESERRKGMCWYPSWPRTLISYTASLAQGLPPLPEPDNGNNDLGSTKSSTGVATSSSQRSSSGPGPFSFSSSAKGPSSASQRATNIKRLKRKASASQDEKPGKDLEKPKKKKKESKSLVSFGDE